MRILFLVIVFISISTISFSQEMEFSGEVNANALISDEEELPFWMYSNKRGRISEDTNISGWISAKGMFYFGDESFMEFGGGGVYQDGVSDNFFIDEAYAHYENADIFFTAGIKQREELYNGLSATNENILWSLNSRPLPGIQLYTNGPVFFRNNYGIGFEASWNEFFFEEDRYMSEAMLHHKSFHLVYRTAGEFQVKAGFKHFAHYGGTNPAGEKPEITRSYWDAVTLQHPSQHHLSSYEVYLSKDFQDFRVELLYNHIAVDRTGRRLGNTPDGRYGIYFEEHEKDRIINSAIYEFYYTHHQSHTSTGYPGDDYFNHFSYRSGWAYHDRIIGAPFFTYDAETDRVVNNKFSAHHFGVGGQFSSLEKTYPYKLLLSYTDNEGTYDNPYDPEPQVLSAYADMRVFAGFLDVNLQLAADFNSVAAPVLGVGLHLRKSL